MNSQVSSDKDNRKFAFELIEKLEKNISIQIRELFEGDKTAADIRTEIRKRIIAYVQKRIDNDEPSEEWPHAGKEKDAKKALGLSDDINVIPNVSVLESNYGVLKIYEGQSQVDFVRRISNGLSLIQDGQTAGQVAEEITGSGLATFTIAMIVATIEALRAGQGFYAALVTGVRAMGSASVVVGVAGLIITEILLYLFWPTTSNSWVVDDWRSGTGGGGIGDLSVNTGSIASFMEQHETEQYTSPLIQIGARKIIGPGDADNMIPGGVFFGEKNIGLFRTEGVMVFRDLTNEFPRFPLLFACLYAMSNGVNVAIDTTKRSALDAFYALYDSRDLYKQATGAEYTFTARTAFTTGEATTGLMYLDKN